MRNLLFVLAVWFATIPALAAELVIGNFHMYDMLGQTLMLGGVPTEITQEHLDYDGIVLRGGKTVFFVFEPTADIRLSHVDLRWRIDDPARHTAAVRLFREMNGADGPDGDPLMTIISPTIPYSVYAPGSNVTSKYVPDGDIVLYAGSRYYLAVEGPARPVYLRHSITHPMLNFPVGPLAVPVEDGFGFFRKDGTWTWHACHTFAVYGDPLE